MPFDDARKLIGWNTSGYGNGYKSWKERKNCQMWPYQGPSDG